MTLTDWTAEQRNLLVRFFNWWHEQAEQDMDHYPMRMQLGSWDEQFAFFRNTVRGRDDA